MEVPAISAVDFAASKPVAPAFERDAVGALLQQMAAPDVLDLISQIDRARPEPNPQLVQSLMAIVTVAAADSRVPAALEAVTALSRLDLRAAERLPHQPGLAVIQKNLADHLTRLKEEATATAVETIAQAHSEFSTMGRHGRVHKINIPEVLAIAERLVESGQHSNIVLAHDLADAAVLYITTGSTQTGTSVVDVTPKTRIAPEIRAKSFSSGALEVIGTRWKRGPTLMLAVTWFVIGLLGGLASLILRALEAEIWSMPVLLEVWGAGSLGIIGFGTYRKMLPPKN